MLYAASELFEKKGLVTVIAGWVWYIGLGGMADIGGLTKAFLPIVMVGLLIHVLINKVGKRGSIGEAVTGELLFGVGLFLLFILSCFILFMLCSLVSFVLLFIYFIALILFIYVICLIGVAYFYLVLVFV